MKSQTFMQTLSKEKLNKKTNLIQKRKHRFRNFYAKKVIYIII